MESPRKRQYPETFNNDETSTSAEKILRQVNEIRKILRCHSVNDSTKKEQIARLLDGIKSEAESIRDSSLMALAAFIRPVDLFGTEEVPGKASDAIGSFGYVIYQPYLGQKVAVKINQNNKDFRKEIETLISVSHDNIVGFRGWGRSEKDMYLVMEHVDETLSGYVKRHRSHEDEGLTPRITWDITKQILQAMVYLHSRDIVHADLRPENILIDAKPIVPKPKICDFGSADYAARGVKQKPRGHARWQESSEILADIKKYDVFSFGLVVLFMKTGQYPYQDCPTGDLQDHDLRETSKLSRQGNNFVMRGIEFRALQEDVLTDLIELCCGEPETIPFFHEIQEKHFKIRKENPYSTEQYGIFFHCGFLKDTLIYVADSVDETDGIIGCEPQGYSSEDMICEVETGKTNNRLKPEDEDLRSAYLESYRDIKRQIGENLINEHVAVAMTSFTLYQTSDSKQQRVIIKLKDINYSHHRSMRSVWRSMDLKRKVKLPYDPVNPIFSTSFGVHIAILTDEGLGSAQKFVFAKRTEKEGRPSPGRFTCGAVRGCKADDYLTPEERCFAGLDETKTYLSLVKAAARGLEKEIGLVLSIEEWEAITFKTIYLKFDNHEWGIGGFINLQNPKISQKHRYSFETLKGLFSGGPKDKHENRELHGVDFNLESMVEWIRMNHSDMASSAKIVAVKVMQERFGYSEVVNAFKTHCL